MTADDLTTRAFRAYFRSGGIGRPTIWDGPAFATIDFTFQTPDGRTYVAEQKAEMAWMNHAYLRLDSSDQIVHHAGRRAFDWFLEAARDPGKRVVRNNGKPITVDGAILVWGAVPPVGRAAAIADYGFSDVLGLEDMLSDLVAWQDTAWSDHVEERASCASGLFEALR